MSTLRRVLAVFVFMSVVWFVVQLSQLNHVEHPSTPSSSSSSSSVPEWLLPLLRTAEDRAQYLKYAAARMEEEREMQALMRNLRH